MTNNGPYLESGVSRDSLPEPRITDCCFDDVFLPRLAAMNLRWRESHQDQGQRLWKLPHATFIAGDAPARFGIQIRREDTNRYIVRMVWNEMQFGWQKVTRQDLLESSVGVLLTALGTSLEYLLDQAIDIEPCKDRTTL